MPPMFGPAARETVRPTPFFFYVARRLMVLFPIRLFHSIFFNVQESKK
jgi:hypothetical protein